MLLFLFYIAAGVLVGLTSGLFGIGGGLIVVPALLPVFAHQGLTDDVAVHMAIGSSMATIILTGLASARAHWQLGNILPELLPALAGGLVLGSLLGAQVAATIPGEILRTVFSLFVLVMAVRMVLGRQPDPHRPLPAKPVVALVGGVIGVLSALVGIGGGSLVVPFLAWCGVAMRYAVGTSAAAGVAIAVAGTVGFMLAGTGDEALPPWSTGYIYWPAVAGITLASTVCAPVGARLATRVPGHLLRWAFAAFLVVVGLRLLFGG
ncbi:sulfite exporter TauE/SafE family protein [Spiribacter halobius]|uniref:Probable membrane transporter protein n=1 Tax=Sediminicurvatus halobius TaxID=2182432 RepID=A0A2U2N6V0_9GAMM|nr:sulfite exporter TauE/SafE family protein [Spiribacter halobius]PWG64916.1 hypothetical protein DEM34_03730 [Spiribacter halobius]UEX78227.1 sulfite exporter TauE/SafE family protein [Spiribacter halobius]